MMCILPYHSQTKLFVDGAFSQWQMVLHSPHYGLATLHTFSYKGFLDSAAASTEVLMQVL